MSSEPFKLPVNLVLRVGSYDRVSIPKWLSFISPGDTLEGYITLPENSQPYPFSKKISTNRTITIGFLKSSINVMPEKVNVTITKIIKSVTSKEALAVAFLSFNKDIKLIYQSKGVGNQQLLHSLRSSAEQIFNQEASKAPSLFNSYEMSERYDKNTDRWTVQLLFSMQGEFTNYCLGVIYLIFSQDNYQSFKSSLGKIEELLGRFTHFLNWDDEFNPQIIGLLLSQIFRIVHSNEEVRYIGLEDILSFEDPIQKKILLFAIKSRKNNGFSLEQLCEVFNKTEEEKDYIRKQLNELVKKELIVVIDEKNENYDISWLV